jgi:hypothetical protein
MSILLKKEESHYGMQDDILSNTETVEDLAAFCEGKEVKLMEPYRYD